MHKRQQISWKERDNGASVLTEVSETKRDETTFETSINEQSIKSDLKI